MSNDSLHPVIKALLEKHGAMGVNQLAKELDIPLSTMQKYLDKQQNYFKKNHARKWVLPDSLANSEMSVATENYTQIISSQITTIDTLINTLTSQFKATLALMEANKPNSAPVAVNHHPSIDKLLKFSETMSKALKQYKNNIPEEYQDLVFNLDITDMCVNEGMNYINGNSNELTSLLLGEVDTLSDETLKILESYQLNK